jgi:hypothetical protein
LQGKDQNNNEVPLTGTRMNHDDVLLLKRTATPISATLLGPLLEAAMGIVQTHRKSILDGGLRWLFQQDPLGQGKRNLVIYSADDHKGAYPRTGGAHQPDSTESAPFHRFVLLARALVYPDGFWNVETSPRRDETVRPGQNTFLLELQHGLAGEYSLGRALILWLSRPSSTTVYREVINSNLQPNSN